jgi:hypothetical protein
MPATQGQGKKILHKHFFHAPKHRMMNQVDLRVVSVATFHDLHLDKSRE